MRRTCIVCVLCTHFSKIKWIRIGQNISKTLIWMVKCWNNFRKHKYKFWVVGLFLIHQSSFIYVTFTCGFSQKAIGTEFIFVFPNVLLTIVPAIVLISNIRAKFWTNFAMLTYLHFWKVWCSRHCYFSPFIYQFCFM